MLSAHQQLNKHLKDGQTARTDIHGVPVQNSLYALHAECM